ncbi:MAG: glycosyltransferase [Crocinitomicaceae bacterium]|nr:glycosyltransferase [Crocinitomicaceae bacterium]
MIKVLRIINRFNLGGPTYNAALLTRYLDDDFETMLIGGLPDEGETDSLHILEKYDVRPIIIPELIRNPNPLSDRKAYRKIKAIIQEFQPDIVHTHASKAGVLGRRAAISCGVEVIVHTYHGHVFHSYFGSIKTFMIKSLERNLANKSTGIVAISQLQKEELAVEHRICRAEKIKVIPLGFDLSDFLKEDWEQREKIRTHYGLDKHTVAIGIVGRIAPIKNHSFFLEVIEKLLRQGVSNIKVFIAGDGSERTVVEEKVKRITEEFGPKIVLTSWVFDIAAFNKGMDIMCLTSNNEGTPVSLIEAQASGLPVLSTDVGGVKDIVLDGESGFITKLGDCETYVENLRLLVENEKLRVKFAEKGREFVRERFSFERLTSEMSEYYRKLLNRKK